MIALIIMGWAFYGGNEGSGNIPDPMNLDSLNINYNMILPSNVNVFGEDTLSIIKKRHLSDSILVEIGSHGIILEGWRYQVGLPFSYNYYGYFSWLNSNGITMYSIHNGSFMYGMEISEQIALYDAQQDMVAMYYTNNNSSGAADFEIWLTTSSGIKERVKFGADGKVIFYSNENGHHIEFDAGTGTNAGTITGSHGLKVGEVEEDSIRLSSQECIRDYSGGVVAYIVGRDNSTIRRVLNADGRSVIFDIDRFLFPADSVEIDSLKVHVYGTLLEGDTLQFRVDSCNNWTYDDGYHTTIETLIPGPLSDHNNLVLVVNRRYSKAEIGRYKYILYLIEPIDGADLHIRHLTVYYKRWY